MSAPKIIPAERVRSPPGGGKISEQGDRRERSALTKWGPLLTLSIAMFIVVLDGTMMNVAVTAIAIAFAFVTSLFLPPERLGEEESPTMSGGEP